MSEIRHVIHDPNSGWLVVEDQAGVPAAPNGNGSVRTFERKREAEAHAKEVVRQHGGGQVVLHTPAGRITEVDTVMPEDAATVLG